MDALMDSPWMRAEHVTFEGRADVSVDGETTGAGHVTLTSRKLLFRPAGERSCCPDVEVPLDVITHAQLAWLGRRLELHVGNDHLIVVKGADVGRMHGTLSELLGAAGLH